MFLAIEIDPSTSSFNSPCAAVLSPTIPNSGFVFPIPTLPSLVITKVLSSLELNWNFCCGVAVNIPTLSVLVSILSAVPPIPTSSLVLTNNLSTSKSPSSIISFLNVTFS